MSGKESAMPSFYCVKFGLLCAALFLVGLIALAVLATAISSLRVKRLGEKQTSRHG